MSSSPSPSSSPSNESKEPASSSPASAPKREPFFDAVRRFSNYHITSVLQSLVGLPSSLSPPATSGWIIDDEADNSAPLSSPPLPQRSGSDSIADEVRKLGDKNDDGNDGKGSGGGGGGVGIPHCSTATAPAAAGKGDAAKPEKMAMLDPDFGELFAIASPLLHMVGAIEATQREMFRTLAQASAAAAAAPVLPACSAATELDYYSFFAHQFQQHRDEERDKDSSPTTTATTATTAMRPKAMVGSYSEVRSVTGPDGVTKTRRVEVKKYADGSEERRESEDLVLPRDSAAIEG